MDTELFSLVKQGSIDKLRSLAAREKIDLTAIRHIENKASLLVWAVIHNQPAMAEFLIEAGVDLEAEMRDRGTALIIAVECSMALMVKLLVDSGANVSIKHDLKKNTIMHLAAIHCVDTEVARILVNAGAAVDVKNAGGLTPLHHATFVNPLPRMAAYLCSLAVDINAKTDCGNTPLHFAVATGNISMMVTLLANGADFTIPSDDGVCVSSNPVFQHALTLYTKTLMSSGNN